MPQQVPEFRFSDDALKVRAVLYTHWCEHGHGPNLRTVHEATGLGRARLVEVYRELDIGLIITLDQRAHNLNVLKMQPFSSYPSQVGVYLGEKFHCWAGCAMESIAISRMPPFAGKELRLESYCACCLEPVTIRVRDGAIVSANPAGVGIHVSTTPREWNTPDIVCMCDSMNFVHDPAHAERYERQISRRGVLFTLEQARRFVSSTGEARMWRFDWEPAYVRPERIIAGIKAIGVDVSNWGA